jgi:hypothetical protein
MSTWPPVESKIRLPVEVSIVLAALPTRTLFAVRDVAEATPRLGVVKDGDVANTKAPLPVSSVTAAAKLADEGVAKKVATLAAKPDTPVEIGRPVQFVRVPEVGVPNNGVVKVGDVANTKRPDPVSSDITPANSEEEVAANALSLLPVVVKVPAIGNVTFVAAVVVSVRLNAPAVAKVELSANVRVAAVAGAVKATLLILVAVATPNTGVTRVGVLANTLAPLPVSSVKANAKLADDGVAKKVATLAAKPDTPVEIGRPVQFVRVPEPGVPNAGVMKVGVLLNTKSPVPLSSDITPANSAEEVAANILSLLPVVVKLPANGNVTLEAAVVVRVKLKAPEVAKVDPSANVSVAAVAGAVKATLLILVAVATPNTGVTRVGDVANTLTPVPVLSVSAAAKLADDGVPKKVATLAAKPDTPVEIGKPVQFVRVPEVGVPNNGVVRVGDVANTKSPLPVSSDMTPANSEEEVAACTDNLSVVTTSVLLVGIVVELIVPETVALAYTRVFVDGLYVSSASEDKATPEPVALREKVR